MLEDFSSLCLQGDTSPAAEEQASLSLPCCRPDDQASCVNFGEQIPSAGTLLLLLCMHQCCPLVPALKLPGTRPASMPQSCLSTYPLLCQNMTLHCLRSCWGMPTSVTNRSHSGTPLTASKSSSVSSVKAVLQNNIFQRGVATSISRKAVELASATASALQASQQGVMHLKWPADIGNQAEGFVVHLNCRSTVICCKEGAAWPLHAILCLDTSCQMAHGQTSTNPASS